mmetsp:Transcript_9511/g.30060  ORF Transcript_9511/g.30060 Transcript_9511/m.30060 type:complete len:210 (+) Transcript_9511:137-766(+)
MASRSGDVVHHRLLANLVARRLDEVEQRRDVARPVVEQLVGLLRLLERDDARRPVDARPDRARRDHLGELAFGLRLAHGEERRHARHLDALIEFGEGAHVVLDDAQVHRLRDVLRAPAKLRERLAERTAGRDLGEQRVAHIRVGEDLVRREELDKPGVERVLGELLELLEPVHLVNLLVRVRREQQVDDRELERLAAQRWLVADRLRVV